MLAPTWDAVRLSLHVLAATIWVGGQLTLAALVPTLRLAGAEVPKSVARRFNDIAWPAFGVLVATGIWNVFAVKHQTDTYKTVVMIKVVVVILSGVTAFLHARATNRQGLAVYGALTGLTALAALVLGIVLGG